jgi:hypothetical protein
MFISYNTYCESLDYFYSLEMNGIVITESIVSSIANTAKGILGKVLIELKNIFSVLHSELSISMSDMIKALKNRKIFDALKYFGFSLKKMGIAFQQLSKIFTAELRTTFIEIQQASLIQAIKSGTMQIDELFIKFPILKRLSGPIIAALLIWIWLNMSFTGDFDLDFDISAIFAAIKGDFSIEKLFGTAEGQQVLFLLGVGIVSGGALSIAWLGLSYANLGLAILYTAMKNSPDIINQSKNVLLKLKIIIINAIKKRKSAIEVPNSLKDRISFKSFVT